MASCLSAAADVGDDEVEADGVVEADEDEARATAAALCLARNSLKRCLYIDLDVSILVRLLRRVSILCCFEYLLLRTAAVLGR